MWIARRPYHSALSLVPWTTHHGAMAMSSRHQFWRETTAWRSLSSWGQPLQPPEQRHGRRHRRHCRCWPRPCPLADRPGHTQPRPHRWRRKTTSGMIGRRRSDGGSVSCQCIDSSGGLGERKEGSLASLMARLAPSDVLPQSVHMTSPSSHERPAWLLLQFTSCGIGRRRIGRQGVGGQSQQNTNQHSDTQTR